MPIPRCRCTANEWLSTSVLLILWKSWLDFGPEMKYLIYVPLLYKLNRIPCAEASQIIALLRTQIFTGDFTLGCLIIWHHLQCKWQ